ncbi:MAG: NAD-dependent epimerase/dehydratase family protein [Candidatus Thermoplasmatota archaeon]|jgi:nucleoside-diphosphate-sugar epimerase|nr:NAD-dependent epimerase [Euryarchaeota archaeon]MED5451813.1 NAD-dependent epimerase/dehydratase family protein [Candidatus Thermoplasmatota archaeon]|tara:strand:+ start:2097 stop:3050 length:954 start_codon:yes stop_codon:yes gene_type:complete
MSGTPGDSILVTGALGQIGRDLVEALRDKHGQDSVIASDVREVAGHPFVEEGRFVRLSVLDGDVMDSVIEDEEVGTIYHLAAILSATGEQNPDLCERVNVGGTITVLEAARRNDLRVYAPSSIAVFGPDAPATAPQITPLNPTTTYGKTKVTGEVMAMNYWKQYGVDTRGIRYPGLVSWKSPAGGGTTDYAVEIFHAALNEGHYDCFVGPETRLPMMYMDDAIRATLELMDAPVESIGDARGGYNVSGISFTARELADTISERVDGFTCEFKPDHRQEYADSWPDDIDDSVAKDDWGWKAEYDLTRMVDEMLDRLSN